MSDTLQNIPLPAGQWVNLYDESGITVGIAISVGNIGTSDIHLTVRVTEPPVGFDAYEILQRKPAVPYRNSPGDVGAWAFSPNQDGKVNVRVAV